ncbi:MAG TPA: hypothetical protein VII33_00865, partial [Nakamurella sp.]
GKIDLYNASAGPTPLIADVAGYYLSGTPTASGSFVPVTPARVLDTRVNNGGATPAANSALAVQITGSGGIPATGVAAVVLTVTVVAPTSPGHIIAYADGTTRPGTSNVNFPAAATVADLAVVPVGANGKIDLYNASAGPTPLIADVAGYYLGPAWSAQTLPFSQAGPATLPVGSLTGVSCPAAGICVAVGNSFAVTLAAGRWTAVTLPSLPGVQDIGVDAVSCTGPTSCVAVGNTDGPAGPGILIETLTAAGWSATSLPPPEFRVTLSDVSCATATACTAVGSGSSFDSDRADISATLTGSTWTADEIPSTSDGSEHLAAVSCPVAGICTAVGGRDGNGNLIVWRLAGGTWTTTALPNPDGNANGTAADLTGVSCVSATQCTALGQGPNGLIVETLVGTTWTFSNPLATSASADVDCSGATSCTAVGGSSAATLAAGQWTGSTPPAPGGGGSLSLAALSCSSPTACVAVGTYRDASGAFKLLAETLAGTTWTAATLPAPTGVGVVDLAGVSCPSATACTAVGHIVDSAEAAHPFIERLSGTAWSGTVLGVPAGASSAWLTAVSCPAATNCTAVGYYSRAADSTTHPLAERLSGTTWTANTTIPEPAGGVRTVLNSVTCPTATTCIAVGGQQVSDATPFTSVVETSSGTTWELSLPPNAGELHGVSCGTAATWLAVGTTASDSLSGGTWNHPQIPNPDDGLSLFAYEVLAVSCTSATVCTAVGDAYNSWDEFKHPEQLAATLSGGTWTIVTGGGSG